MCENNKIIIDVSKTVIPENQYIHVFVHLLKYKCYQNIESSYTTFTTCSGKIYYPDWLEVGTTYILVRIRPIAQLLMLPSLLAALIKSCIIPV